MSNAVPGPTPSPNPGAQPKPPAPARRLSPRVALINFDQCTGCEACIAVAPHDTCLVRVSEQPFTSSVEVMNDQCTGCTLCMKICPWDAITMVPRPAAV
jgi:Na+-translocating ferredoxin:NAD+ oxidoreductase subunit B